MNKPRETKQELKTILVEQDPKFWLALSPNDRDRALKVTSLAAELAPVPLPTGVYH